jgi:hypothetical protein
VSGHKPAVLLTANEMKAAEQQAGWELAVVTNALTNPQLKIHPARILVDSARPYLFKAELPA